MKNRFLGFLVAFVVSLAIIAGADVYWLRHTPVVKAQNAPLNLTMGTTVTANIYGGQNYFYLLVSGGNVTTFNLVNQNAAGTSFPYLPGIITIVFQQDGVGSRTVGFGTMFATAVIPTVFATASKYTMMQFQYDTVSGLYYPLSTTALHN